MKKMEPSFLIQLSPLSHVGWSLSPRSDHARSAHQRPWAARTDGGTPDRHSWGPKAFGALTSSRAAGTARLPGFRRGAGRPGYATTGLPVPPGPAGEASHVLRPRRAVSEPNPGPPAARPSLPRTHSPWLRGRGLASPQDAPPTCVREGALRSAAKPHGSSRNGRACGRKRK